MGDDMIGEIKMFAGTFAPRGWLYCEGQLLYISNNQALFSILGTQYGGDGRTNFQLPDLRGRVPLAPGEGPGLSNHRAGQAGGLESHRMTVAEMPMHDHTMGSHTHEIPNHLHAIDTHTHPSGSHTHDIPNHQHTLNPHSHTLRGIGVSANSSNMLNRFLAHSTIYHSGAGSGTTFENVNSDSITSSTSTSQTDGGGTATTSTAGTTGNGGSGNTQSDGGGTATTSAAGATGDGGSGNTQIDGGDKATTAAAGETGAGGSNTTLADGGGAQTSGAIGGATGNAGQSRGFPIMQPFLAIHYIIDGIYPSRP